MSMTWFKLHHEIIDDIKIRRFTPQEKWAWIVLLSLASKSSDRGIVEADNDDLADYCEFNCTQDWLYYRDKLIGKGMLEINGFGSLTIVHWSDRQSKKPSDDPARVKDRVTKSRAKKKSESASQSQEDVSRYKALQVECNADVSPQIRLDEIRSEEKRLDQNLNSLYTQPPKISDSDFDVFREIWNRDRPKHWAECQSLNKKRISELKKFTRENGDRSLEIFQAALKYAKSDFWCNKPQTKLTIDNFLTNNKPVSWAEKASSSDFSGDSQGNTHEDWLNALEAV